MNDWEDSWEDMSYYDSEYCDGADCCHDCGQCYIAERIGEMRVREELGDDWER